jgi:hypothetical protein
MFSPDAGVGFRLALFLFWVVDGTVSHEACEKLFRKVASVVAVELS